MSAQDQPKKKDLMARLAHKLAVDETLGIAVTAEFGFVLPLYEDKPKSNKVKKLLCPNCYNDLGLISRDFKVYRKGKIELTHQV